jgi:hypothetical protein
VARRNGAAPATDHAVNGGRKHGALGKRVSACSRSQNPPQANPHWFSVYDGRLCIGHLISRGKLGVEAFDVGDRSLGIFPSLKQAIAAFDGGGP